MLHQNPINQAKLGAKTQVDISNDEDQQLYSKE